MSQICQVTGKKPITGNNVSHAHNKTKRRFMPNIKKRRLWSEEESRFYTLNVSTKGMRIIDKKGFDLVLKELRERGEKI